jgi:monoamine oxidase
MKKKVVIVGAGVGGLACAARLAARGFSVDVFEKLSRCGGRNNSIQDRGFKFDTGPSFVCPIFSKRCLRIAAATFRITSTSRFLIPIISYFMRTASLYASTRTATRPKRSLSVLKKARAIDSMILSRRPAGCTRQ